MRKINLARCLSACRALCSIIFTFVITAACSIMMTKQALDGKVDLDCTTAAAVRSKVTRTRVQDARLELVLQC